MMVNGMMVNGMMVGGMTSGGMMSGGMTSGGMMPMMMTTTPASARIPVQSALIGMVPATVGLQNFRVANLNG